MDRQLAIYQHLIEKIKRAIPFVGCKLLKTADNKTPYILYHSIGIVYDNLRTNIYIDINSQIKIMNVPIAEPTNTHLDIIPLSDPQALDKVVKIVKRIYRY